MIESVDRQHALNVDKKLVRVVADRGFDGAKRIAELESKDIASEICPKNPQLLLERLSDQTFRHWQTRRAGTEARIAILKNHTGGRVWRAKGLAHRKLAVGWSVLAHNLTWIGQTVREQKEEAPPKVA